MLLSNWQHPTANHHGLKQDYLVSRSKQAGIRKFHFLQLS